MTARPLRTRYDGTCAACGAAVAAGVSAFWDKDLRRLTCEGCEQTSTVPSAIAAVELAPAKAKAAAGGPGGKRIRLRWGGLCSNCGTPLRAGTQAWWDAATKTLRCGSCHEAASGEPPAAAPAAEAAPVVGQGPGPVAAATSTAGGSARSKYERLSARRKERVRAAHPVLGGVILALTDEPRSTTVWARGAAGERRVGALLDGLAGSGVRALHDRRILRSRANIDHLAVAPSGVWVIDAKRYQGPVAKKDVGCWFSTDLRLYVGRRDCTKLVTAMARQVNTARTALGPDWANVPIHPLLCFVDAEWSWFPKPFTLQGVIIAWPKATAELLRQAGPLTPDQVGQIADHLARRLPPAS